ncbi:hypothetical protein Tco_1049787 [Tanacetum coccineum]
MEEHKRSTREAKDSEPKPRKVKPCHVAMEERLRRGGFYSWITQEKCHKLYIKNDSLAILECPTIGFQRDEIMINDLRNGCED